MRVPSIVKRHGAVAVLSGVLVAISLSGLDVFWLAWVAWIPLFLIVATSSRREAVACGCIAGFTQTLCMLYWVPPTISLMGKSLSMGVTLLFILCATWSGGLAAFCLLAHLYQKRALAGQSLGSDLRYVLGLAALWVVFESFFTHAFSALPWVSFLAGYSQWNHPILIQVASATGVHGVSFFVIAVNLAFVRAVLRRSTQPLLVAAALVACVLTSGAYRLRTRPPVGTVRVAVLQANISPRERLDPEQGRELAGRYLSLSEQANAAHADLVVWTESAIPWPVRDGDDLVETAVGITGPSRAHHLIGAPVESTDQKGRYLNSALLVSPEGLIIGLYSKLRPLFMAETAVCFPGMERKLKLHPSASQFVRGSEQPILSSPVGALGVNICNENFHADLIRQSVRKGATFLVNLTNDGWFRQNMPLRQHFIVNPFRAVENKRALVVANNVGVSAVIDAYGRLTEKSPIRRQICLVGEITPHTSLSIYSRLGNAFVYACVFWTVLTAQWGTPRGLKVRRAR